MQLYPITIAAFLYWLLVTGIAVFLQSWRRIARIQKATGLFFLLGKVTHLLQDN